MSNSIFEDALFLAAGGIVGLIAGAALMSDDEEDEEDEEEAVAPKAVGRNIDELIASLKSEAQQAFVNCETDEEREEVSASIRQSIEGLQAVLAKHTAVKGTEEEASTSFINLGEDGQPQPNESFAPKPAQRFQDLAAKLEQALDETLADLPPVTSRPSAPATCGDS